MSFEYICAFGKVFGKSGEKGNCHGRNVGDM